MLDDNQRLKVNILFSFLFLFFPHWSHGNINNKFLMLKYYPSLSTNCDIFSFPKHVFRKNMKSTALKRANQQQHSLIKSNWKASVNFWLQISHNKTKSTKNKSFLKSKCNFFKKSKSIFILKSKSNWTKFYPQEQEHLSLKEQEQEHLYI